jgi:hypothetical protein
LSHQFPSYVPLRQEPGTSCCSVDSSMSRSVLPVKPGIMAVQVPARDRPSWVCADQVPSQPWALFRADHVPCITCCPCWSRSVQEPVAALGLSGESRVYHRPRSTWLGPTVAVHVPCKMGRVSCAAAQEHNNSHGTRSSVQLLTRVFLRRWRIPFKKPWRRAPAHHAHA